MLNWVVLLALLKRGGGGGGGTDFSALEVYVADFLGDPPTVTDGALDKWHRALVS